MSGRGQRERGAGLHLSVGILCSKSCQRPRVRECGPVPAFTATPETTKEERNMLCRSGTRLHCVWLRTSSCAEDWDRLQTKKTPNKHQGRIKKRDWNSYNPAGGRARADQGDQITPRLTIQTFSDLLVSPELHQKDWDVCGELLCSGWVLSPSPGE